jgi:hypothetical protein
MTKNNLKGSIDGHIKSLGTASKAVFLHLGVLSRELLMYVPDSKDIGAVNRTLSVLTFADRAYAVSFFREFLPWKYDATAQMFTEMVSGERRKAEMFEAIEAFLKSEVVDEKTKQKREATIWDWLSDNTEREVRKINVHYQERIANMIKNAMSIDPTELNPDGTVKRIGPVEVFNAVLDGGITLDALMELATNKAKEIKEMATKSNVANDEGKDKNKDKPAKQLSMA